MRALAVWGWGFEVNMALLLEPELETSVLKLQPGALLPVISCYPFRCLDDILAFREGGDHEMDMA